MKPNFVPNYIVNLSKVIREFPRTTKPFYVYRGARINEKSPTSPHQSINPMPFSTSLHAWMALNFARLKSKDCCLYRIKIDPNVPCIILGDTPFDELKAKHPNYSKGHLSKHIQFEVVLAPGILKEKSRKISHKITDKEEYDRLNKTLKDKTGKLMYNPPPMKQTGVLMIDVEYIPLHPSLISNLNQYEYNIRL